MTSSPRWAKPSLHAESLAARFGDGKPWRDAPEPGTLFHQSPAPTELAAARKAQRGATSVRAMALAWITEAGEHGATAKELGERLAAARGKPPSDATCRYSVAPRLAPMTEAGVIRKTGGEREGFAVYVAVEKAA